MLEAVPLVASIIAIIIGAVITFAVSKNYNERAEYLPHSTVAH